MMRYSLLAALALTTACEWGFPDYTDGVDGNTSAFLRDSPEGFSQESTLWADTDGTVVDETGFVSGAAMVGTTCQVDVNTGYVGNDINPNYSSDERIVDGQATPDGVAGIAISTNQIDVVRYQDWDSGVVASYDMTALDARFTDNGIATIDNDGGGCEVTWVSPGGDITAQGIAAGNCIGGFDVTANGVAVVNTSAGLTRVTGTGAETIADSADLVAYDTGLDLFYTANSGGSVVTAMTEDGLVEWTATVEGGIVDLESMGARGMVAISVEYADLTGGLLLLDGASGAMVNQAMTVSAAEDLSLSGDGHTIAAAVPGQVHYISAF